MTKLPVLKPREAIRALEKAGFKFERQKGSHRIYIKDKLSVIVSYHNKDLKTGTLRHIIEQSGLEPKQFLDLL